jgi:hypothetical protein
MVATVPAVKNVTSGRNIHKLYCISESK